MKKKGDYEDDCRYEYIRIKKATPNVARTTCRENVCYEADSKPLGNGPDLANP